MMDGKTLPFKLERGRRGCLAEQIAALLREAIVTGYYKPGEVLPPIRELAQRLEVGRVNVERAIARLSEEGLLNPRPKVGCVVCGTEAPLWKGQVLIVVPPGGANHLINTVGGMLRDALVAAGYLFLVAAVPCREDGTFDFAMLRTMLRQRVDLVVLLHDKKAIAQWISAQGVAFIRVTSDKGVVANCVGDIRYEPDRAFSDFAEHCRERNVKNLTELYIWQEMRISSSCRRHKIHVDEWHLDYPKDMPMDGPGVAQVAADAVRERLEREGHGWVAEVLCLCDDYLASGAMTALLAAGVRIPDDVRIVVWTNRGSGCGPAFVKPLTRLELDCRGYGSKVSECVLTYLRTGNFPENAKVDMEYIRGATF